MRRPSSVSTSSPIAKNVPRPPWRSSCWAIGSVHCDGPSSNVSATIRSAIPRRASTSSIVCVPHDGPRGARNVPPGEMR